MLWIIDFSNLDQVIGIPIGSHEVTFMTNILPFYYVDEWIQKINQKALIQVWKFSNMLSL